MGTIHLVFGPQGAGKSIYARELAGRTMGVRFSIDEWMGQLYGPDLPKPLNFSWIMEKEFEPPTEEEMSKAIVFNSR